MPTRPLDAVGAAITLLRRVADPRERLDAIQRVRSELVAQSVTLEDLLGSTIAECRAVTPPATWQEIGDILGVTSQRAHQIGAAYLMAKPRTTTPTTEGTQP